MTIHNGCQGPSPILVGTFTRYEYIDLMANLPFDIIQPDAAGVGGISELKRIADMAGAWNLRCVPHIGCSSGTGIGIHAGLQVILSCDNAPLIEFDAYGGLGWEGFLVNPPVVTDGRVQIPARFQEANACQEASRRGGKPLRNDCS
ncbi:enolase C-terminal domain-like protein [Dactylosporangium sp. NPDC000244]|uniref:enolase C-terminal domain-like protein n=1 Tax=Dactylosporangium sp. NPDC000244 TaxID=3154365 RepID=UPI003331616B